MNDGTAVITHFDVSRIPRNVVRTVFVILFWREST